MEHEIPIQLPVERTVGGKSTGYLRIKRWAPSGSVALEQAAVDRKIARAESSYRRLGKTPDEIHALTAELYGRALTNQDYGRALADADVLIDCMMEAIRPYHADTNREGLIAWLGGVENVERWFWQWVNMSKVVDSPKKETEKETTKDTPAPPDPTDGSPTGSPGE